MNHDEAMQHGLGYAAGREDASSWLPRTATTAAEPDGSGFMQFAEAYAAGWDRYNSERFHFMVPARAAYAAWQDSGGATIYRLAYESEYSLRRLAADGELAAAVELASRCVTPETPCEHHSLFVSAS